MLIAFLVAQHLLDSFADLFINGNHWAFAFDYYKWKTINKHKLIQIDILFVIGVLIAIISTVIKKPRCSFAKEYRGFLFSPLFFRLKAVISA